jgi:hypothetical protein
VRDARVVGLVVLEVWEWEVFCLLGCGCGWDGVVVSAVAAGGLVVVVSMGSVAIFGSGCCICGFDGEVRDLEGVATEENGV